MEAEQRCRINDISMSELSSSSLIKSITEAHQSEDVRNSCIRFIIR